MIDTSLIPNIELFIAQVPPLSYLPKSLISQIANNINIRYIPKGENIIDSQNNEHNLYIIRVGEVEQINPDGRLRAKLESGSIFGFSILNNKDEYCAFALENTLIYQVSYQMINDILKQYPEYIDYFSKETSTRLSIVAKNNILATSDNILMKSVSDVANPQIVLVDSKSSIQQTAQQMTKYRRSSAIIMDQDKIVGIVNDRDMTKQVVSKGINISAPVTSIMNPNPPTVTSNELVLNAVSLMMQHNIRSLPVLLDGKVHSILTAIDLLKYSSLQSIFIINNIFQVDSLEQLIELSQQKELIFTALIKSGATHNNIMKVMTLIADAFSQKLLQLAEEQLGSPPCSYVWNVLGSQARYEMHLLSDQDSSIIVERELSPEENMYFMKLSTFVIEGLEKCGYPKCDGNYTANHSQWCQPISQWKNYFEQWIINPEKEYLLHASVLMDFRPIHGNRELSDILHRHVTTLTQNNSRFLRFMTANAVRVKPPISIFRNFVLTKEGENKNKLNLKKRAISLLVDLARIYAFSTNLSETLSTEERFSRCYQLGVIDKLTLDNVLETYQFVCDMRFKHQLQKLQNNQNATNHISPDELTLLERNQLKDVFRLIAKFQEAAEIRFSQRGIIR
ncbi:putative nucleotidyltransferase substrate binding domain-containing protein [Lonepinella sp. MS14437]|uniref:putative nucleotidyltransferase substrate binding domain-containing protein n=1 Tax=Lonepinella sp. MS14437 TaxID=3003620 RepID=UPI0036DE4705